MGSRGIRSMERIFGGAAALLAAAVLSTFAFSASPARAAADKGATTASAGTAARPESAKAPADVSRPASSKSAKTVVTFAWGGGLADQMPAVSIFHQYEMHATFFVPTGLVCVLGTTQCAQSSPYLTLGDVQKIASDGNEIGGLSVLHQQLTNLPAAEVKREICDDRMNLFRWGFHATDFAYPFAVENQQVEELAQQCGYNGGLGAGELRGAGLCTSCAWAETIPPQNPYVVRAPIEVNSVNTVWTLHTYQAIVQGAQQHGGGWVIFTIHDVCTPTCAFGVTPTLLRSVLTWLRGQQSHDTVVETMAQVVGGAVRPPVAGPPERSLPGPGVVNSKLTAHQGTYPACFQTARYGKNIATFSYHASGGPFGEATETVRMTKWKSGDAKLLQGMDLGMCAPPVNAGRSYTLGAWYKSTRSTQFEAYYRTSVGNWVYWVTAPALPATATWKNATWTTPPVPAGATAVSFGLTADSAATVTTTGYSIKPAPNHKALILLICLGLVVLATGLITRGHYRYVKSTRDEADAQQVEATV
jgi:peptidoglycan/xylan/chitin deacetylase (PgdA/CDA1 family)